MNAARIAAEAKRTGTVWLGGEMEFPANQGPSVAYYQAVKVAEACGYVVSWRYSRSAFSVSGGEIPGYIVLDWFNSDRKELVKVEVWTCEAGYLEGMGV